MVFLGAIQHFRVNLGVAIGMGSSLLLSSSCRAVWEAGMSNGTGMLGRHDHDGDGLPGIMDPMYWLGEGGPFASAVLPGILIIVFIETGLLFPLLPGDSLLFTGGLLAAAPGTRR